MSVGRRYEQGRRYCVISLILLSTTMSSVNNNCTKNEGILRNGCLCFLCVFCALHFTLSLQSSSYVLKLITLCYGIHFRPVFYFQYCELFLFSLSWFVCMLASPGFDFIRPHAIPSPSHYFTCCSSLKMSCK